MSRKYRVIAAVCAMLAVVLSACGADDDGSGARSYIGSQYTRARNLDELNNGIAYTATKQPGTVADEITEAARPMDRRSTGALTFLQYRDDIIALSPYGAGTKVLVDSYRNGYRRHHSYVSAYGWPSDNSGFRGGGPGDGK